MFESADFLVRRDRILLLLKRFRTVTTNLTDDDALFRTGSEPTILHRPKKFDLVFKYFTLIYMILTILFTVCYYISRLVFESAELLFQNQRFVYNFPFR